MRKIRLPKLRFENNREMLTLLIAVLALILSSLSFYFQFFYINKNLFVTQIPPNIDSKAEIAKYNFIFTNSGDKPVTIVGINYIANVNRGIPYLYKVKSFNDQITLASGTTSLNSIDIPFSQFIRKHQTVESLVFKFLLVDYSGKVKQLTYNACYIPTFKQSDLENKITVISSLMKSFDKDGNPGRGSCNRTNNIYD